MEAAYDGAGGVGGGAGERWRSRRSVAARRALRAAGVSWIHHFPSLMSPKTIPINIIQPTT